MRHSYRGRGDTLPRGYGGSITKAIKSQLLCSAQEDHTEQNRYLRNYATVSSAIDHLHQLYSAHLSLRLSSPPAQCVIALLFPSLWCCHAII
jgi:hypothetical protein